MKKTILIFISVLSSIIVFAFDNEVAHPAIIEKAYQILEARYVQSGGSINDLLEMKNSIYNGYIRSGAYNEDLIGNCNTANLVTAPIRPVPILGSVISWIVGSACSNYDPIYGYDIQVYAHFWDADKANDYHHYFSCKDLIGGIDVGSLRRNNAYEKMIQYMNRLTNEQYSGNKDLFYEYLGRMLHLFADMGVPAHVHVDPHIGGGAEKICENFTDDKYETYFKNNKDAALGNTNLYDLNGNGGFIYNTPSAIQSDLFYYLFYTMNQLSDYFPSNNLDGDKELPLGSNEILQTRYAEFAANNYTSDNSAQIATRLTTFMENATATILYWYGIQTGQLRSIRSLSLNDDYSSANQNISLPDNITLNPGFSFDAQTTSKSLNIEIADFSSSKMKSDQENTEYFANNSITSSNDIENMANVHDVVEVSPNPSKGRFIVTLPSGTEASMKIFNQIGNQVFEIKLHESVNPIDIQNMASGIYILLIDIGSKKVYRKIIVE